MAMGEPVCLITGGFTAKNLRLQPWRYLAETARQLAAQGRPVTVVTDGIAHHPAREQLDGVAIHRLPTVNRYRWGRDDQLLAAVRQQKPGLILWHLGLPSFVHQQLDGWPDAPVVGIFPGLVYTPRELLRLGLRRILRGYRLSAIHLLGAMVPRRLIHRAVNNGSLRCLVVQTEATRQRLLAAGLRGDQVKVIPPGVDEEWHATCHDGREDVRLRRALGFDDTDTVVLYFGSPAPLRGLHTLVRALAIARRAHPALKLLILNRRRSDELLREDAELRRLIQQNDVQPHIRMVSGFLAPDQLVRHVAASDIVALPFELVPADAPLSVLEAQALGKPVVTTTVASLPELVAPGQGYLAAPADPVSLAQAICQAAAEWPDRRAKQPAHVRRWQEVGKEWSQLIQSL
ncbi:MAG TPA: glycosyltransferase family 4 protein [Caldilineaceae bacterium]|nr:glycosyltransferase family 4 protein [Caldilineaceae bacterium]